MYIIIYTLYRLVLSVLLKVLVQFANIPIQFLFVWLSALQKNDCPVDFKTLFIFLVKYFHIRKEGSMLLTLQNISFLVSSESDILDLSES